MVPCMVGWSARSRLVRLTALQQPEPSSSLSTMHIACQSTSSRGLQAWGMHLQRQQAGCSTPASLPPASLTKPGPKMSADLTYNWRACSLNLSKHA